ncbi:hypothetical protein D3C72_2513860 [compost metagenome]
MAGDATGQGNSADGHLNQTKHAAAAQALADHDHPGGDGTCALPAVDVMFAGHMR